MKKSDLPVLKTNKFHQQFQAPGSSKARGVAILISNKIRFDWSNIESVAESRYIFVKGLLEGRPYTLGSVYTPNTQQLKFLEDAFQALSYFKEGSVVLVGDLNFVADIMQDHSRHMQTEKIRKGNKSCLGNSEPISESLCGDLRIPVLGVTHTLPLDLTHFLGLYLSIQLFVA